MAWLTCLSVKRPFAIYPQNVIVPDATNVYTRHPPDTTISGEPVVDVAGAK
jgi:hypothetical protein